MSDLPRLSIVLPTFNRRRRLERVLAGLDRQRAAPGSFEVIVIDDGSTDDTADWLSRHSVRPYPLRHLTQANAGPAKARNQGVSLAQGELILFIDDDVEPTPELVEEHLLSHGEPDVVVLGPLCSLSHYAQPWVTWEQQKLEQQYAAMESGRYPPSFRQFWTGNASVARRHVLAAGGFDAAFLRAEDVELGRRLHELGLTFRFNPRARGFHHAERSLQAWERMHQSYGALEVKIFGQLGDEEFMRTLAGNFGRLNPLTRELVSSCLGHPLRTAAAKRALRGWLGLGQAARFTPAVSQACSALANLIYWQASAEALGRERWRQVRELSRHER
jgi:glycosyltransferase involved in cell wall biosynthesis